METENLIAEITAAFENVELDGGIGLTEADAMDSYKDDKFLAECRVKDEKHSWQLIPIHELNKHHNGLSYFDAKGMRFHLPAFMIAIIKNEYHFDIPYALTDISGNSNHLFTLFSNKQKQAVKLFLEYLLENRDYEFDQPNIETVIESYWAK
jgi:hypothetical protein